MSIYQTPQAVSREVLVEVIAVEPIRLEMSVLLEEQPFDFPYFGDIRHCNGRIMLDKGLPSLGKETEAETVGEPLTAKVDSIWTKYSEELEDRVGAIANNDIDGTPMYRTISGRIEVIDIARMAAIINVQAADIVEADRHPEYDPADRRLLAVTGLMRTLDSLDRERLHQHIGLDPELRRQTLTEDDFIGEDPTIQSGIIGKIHDAQHWGIASVAGRERLAAVASDLVHLSSVLRADHNLDSSKA